MALSITGAGAAAASFLGVLSTAIGIYATIENQRLKATADQQSIQIAQQDARIRDRADVRADTNAERDYIIKVFDKASAALESGDAKRQTVALALIATLSDPALRERLSGAFQASPAVEDPKVRSYAESVQQQAQVAITAQRQAADIPWNIDVFWCTAAPQNQALASRIYTALSAAERGRIRLRPWSPQENGQLGYQVRRLEIRAEAGEMDRAGQLKAEVEKAAGSSFAITTVANRTVNYLSVFVCQP